MSGLQIYLLTCSGLWLAGVTGFWWWKYFRAYVLGAGGRFDSARVIFEAVANLLTERADDWRHDQFRLWLPDTEIALWISNADYGLAVTTTLGQRVSPSNGLQPGPYWRLRLHRLVRKRMRDAELAASINTLCDELEGLERSNVIPLRRA